jgi:hypothetical protein
MGREAVCQRVRANGPGFPDRSFLIAARVACVPARDRAREAIATELGNRFRVLTSDVAKMPGMATRLRSACTRLGDGRGHGAGDATRRRCSVGSARDISSHVQSWCAMQRRACYARPMLDLARVSGLVGEVAQATLPGRGIASVVVKPSVDSFGNDSLRITVVVRDVGSEPPNGESIVAFEGELRNRMEQLGDERLPIVDILTPEDLAADVDPES